MLIRLLISGLALAFFTGCSGGQARSSLLKTPLGPDLEALWNAHGGLAQWESFAGVSLDYEGTGMGALASAGKVSCKVIIDFGPPPSVDWVPGQSTVPTGPEKELPSLFLANMFHLPFLLNNPGWKFRRAMVLRATNKPTVEFEASRPGDGHEIGPYYLSYTNPRGGLRSVHYFCRSSALGEGVYRVDYHDYKFVQGVLVATARKHYSISGSGNSFESLEKEPFSPLQKRKSPALWIERFSNLRFLSPEDLEGAPGRKTQNP